MDAEKSWKGGRVGGVHGGGQVMSTLRAYDADGNMIEDSHFRYCWNAENRMIRAEEKTAPSGRQPHVLTYAYDHMGRNVIKNGASYVWDGYNIIVENASSSNCIINAWGLDLDGTMQGAGGVGGLLAVEKKGGAVYMPAYDANGNITEYVDAEGNVAAHYEYFAFGKTVLMSSGDDNRAIAHLNPYRFSSEYADDALGLVYYNYRHYNPGDGRWTGRDPLAETELTHDEYRFCENNCISYIDYLGCSTRAVKGAKGVMKGVSRLLGRNLGEVESAVEVLLDPYDDTRDGMKMRGQLDEKEIVFTFR